MKVKKSMYVKTDKKLKVMQYALEERKLIQSIINQQEVISFKVRGWAIALFSGMTYMHIKEPTEFPSSSYFITVMAILFIFAVLEIRHMTAFFKLVNRCENLDEVLGLGIQDALNSDTLPEGSKWRQNIVVPMESFFNQWVFMKVKAFFGVDEVKFRYLEVCLVYLFITIASMFVACI